MAKRKRVALVCKQCGKGFERSQCFAAQKFCSRKCAGMALRGENHPRWVDAKFLPCMTCGSPVLTNKGTARKSRGRQFCSYKCFLVYRKVNAESYRVPVGTVSVGKDGYAYIKVENQSWRYEHTVVAEKMIGRPLLRSEVVHHVNGSRSDNRPENLRVMTNSQHQDVHREAELLGLAMMAYLPDPIGLGC